MGLLTFLRNTLGIPKPPGTAPANAPPPNKRRPRIEIFGPRGIRRMLRMLWHITHSHSEFAYAAHELLFDGEQPSVAADVQPDQEGVDESDIRRESECVGRDIWCDEQGFWKGIVDMTAKQAHGLWGAIVDAGPIQHRGMSSVFFLRMVPPVYAYEDPCIGYIIREIPRYPLTIESPMPRKLVILGDTYDPSTIVPLIHADDPPSMSSSSSAHTSSSPPPDSTPHGIDFSVLPVVNPHGNGVPVRVPVSLLIHEATDAYLPPHVDPQQKTGKNRTPESVAEKAVLRGHSTPAMAGAFARSIAAERLVMNHIGARCVGLRSRFRWFPWKRGARADADVLQRAHWHVGSRPRTWSTTSTTTAAGGTSSASRACARSNARRPRRGTRGGACSRTSRRRGTSSPFPSRRTSRVQLWAWMLTSR